MKVASKVAKLYFSRVIQGYTSKKKVKSPGGDFVVYEYSDRQISTRNKDKAERIEKLRHGIDGLRKQVKKDLKSDDEHTRDVALAIGLMDVTYERVGNDQSAKDGHFGVTGWKVKHLTMGKGKVTVKYVGKSGVDHEKVIDKAESVTAIKAAIKGKKPNDEVCGGVSAEDVNGYLKKFDVTAKDIRGYHANTEMQDRLKAVRAKGGKLPSDKKELAKKLKEEFKQALEETAEAVGHEPATLKSQYLVPGLEDEFLTNGKVSEKLTKKGSKTANYLSIPASFLAERGWEFGNAEWRDQGNLKGEALQSWLEKQLPKLSVPVDIEINKDGTMDFQDGHHRVRAAMLINSDVLVKVKRNKLDPNVWTEYLDRINKGFTYREINPDGENLNRRGIPSVDALKAGRHSGLRDSELFEFYVHFDGHQDSGKKTGVSGGAKGKSASILQGMRSEEQVHREKFISSGKNPYGTRCPICDLPARSSCRCKVGDKTCPNGHTWVRCPVHKTRIVFHQSTHDGSLILEYGTCWCNLGGDVYPPDDPAPVPPVTNLVSRYLAKRIVQ